MFLKKIKSLCTEDNMALLQNPKSCVLIHLQDSVKASKRILLSHWHFKALNHTTQVAQQLDLLPRSLLHFYLFKTCSFLCHLVEKQNFKICDCRNSKRIARHSASLLVIGQARGNNSFFPIQGLTDIPLSIETLEIKSRLKAPTFLLVLFTVL